MAITGKNLITSRINTYLKQEPDHAWLLMPLNGGGGSDQFKNTVVCATFSSTLTQSDFESYVDMTFDDVSDDLKQKLKALRIVRQQSFQQEDVVFNYDNQDSKIAASLLQVIAQKNDSNELQVVVGVISLIRTPSKGWVFNSEYWGSNKDKVTRGLQYVFGIAAQKELSDK